MKSKEFKNTVFQESKYRLLPIVKGYFLLYFIKPELKTTMGM